VVTLTPDQRLRVFVSSTLQELADERARARGAIAKLRLAPVMFELGARPHPPRNLYRAYLEQSHIFVGIYWQRYGWVAPGEIVSGLEDEYRLSGDRPKLIYIKEPAPEREARLEALIDSIRDDNKASFKSFASAKELAELLENDLAVLLSERFELARLEATPLESSRGGTLPIAPTPLIGREDEVAAVKALLLQSDARLVTLSGPGGVGKTRVALQVAAETVADFADGVIFVSLAAVGEPRLVVSALAQALGVTESGHQPLLESLKVFLRDKEMLLLIDNFEQVVAAAPLLSELLIRSPRLKLLVTSRELLHLSGEHVFFVPPLALPEEHAPVEALPRYAAVELFIQRARAVKPGFSVTSENILAIAELCKRLDGLPLAIELAAARIKLFSPQVMLERLEKHFALLMGGARDLPLRQRTLHSTINWSYELLSDDEKRLFEQLSVFTGGRTLEAVEAVCNKEGDLDVLVGLSSLIDKNLLRQKEGQAGEPRFVMLRTLREYALERLEEHGEAETIRRTHGEYFLAFAEEAEPHLTGPQQAAWLEHLETEHGNLRAALTWAEACGEGDLELRLAGALGWFWWLHGHLNEGRERLARALAQAGEGKRTAARAKALDGAGTLAFYQGDLAAARALHEESLALRRELGDRQGVADSLDNLGATASQQGDYSTARFLHEESLKQRQALGDKRGMAQALNNLGGVAGSQGDYPLARALYERGLALARELKNDYLLALLLTNLGEVALQQEDFASACSFLEESIATARRLGNRYLMAYSLNLLGLVAYLQDDYASARAHYQKSLTIRQALGDKQGIASSLEVFAGLSAVQREPMEAARLWGTAKALREAIAAPLAPNERPRHEREVAAARAQLDEERFAAAWAEGRAMPLEEAIACALEDSKKTRTIGP
jgi:predicted ATPase